MADYDCDGGEHPQLLLVSFSLSGGQQVVSRWSAGGQVEFHQVAGGDQGDFWPVVGVARCRVVKVQHVMTTRWKCLVMILSDGW